jgi:prevent-host-death family protein
VNETVRIEDDKWVGARELSRKTSELLDQVASGAVVKICRHGRPVATLSPLPDAPVRHGAGARGPAGESDRMGSLTPEEEDQLRGIDPIQKQVLEAVADGCAPDRLASKLRGHEPSAIAVALGRLEIGRLIVKDFGGYSLTIRGARFVRLLAGPSG